jgi:flavin-binding protein dodecin
VAFKPGPRGNRIRAFEGASEYRDESSADSLHEAIQHAAREAARTLADEGEELPQAFEVSRIQVLVGNPNVKAYSVILTPTDPGG